MNDGHSDQRKKITTHGYLKNVILSSEIFEASLVNDLITESNFMIDIIPDSLQIRHANKCDLERTKSSSNGILHDIPPEDRIIIEWIHDDIHAISEAYNVIDQTLLALRLLKEKSVFVTHIYNFVEQDMEYSDKVSALAVPHPDNIFFEPYYLTSNDEKTLQKLFKKIKSVDLKKESSLRLACDRYGRIFYDLFEEDKLIDICISFEALFLKGEQSRTSYGMGQLIGLACSMLIGKKEKDRINISNKIKLGFKYRNDVIHGKIFNRNEVRKIIPVLNNYLRQSLVKLLD